MRSPQRPWSSKHCRFRRFLGFLARYDKVAPPGFLATTSRAQDSHDIRMGRCYSKGYLEKRRTFDMTRRK